MVFLAAACDPTGAGASGRSAFSRYSLGVILRPSLSSSRPKSRSSHMKEGRKARSEAEAVAICIADCDIGSGACVCGCVCGCVGVGGEVRCGVVLVGRVV